MLLNYHNRHGSAVMQGQYQADRCFWPMHQLLIILLVVDIIESFAWTERFWKVFAPKPSQLAMSILDSRGVPNLQQLQDRCHETAYARDWVTQEQLRSVGEGDPHTDAKIRLFGETAQPDIMFYRDAAAWCPYCQKVWILLEEKRIPYRVEKVNMRSYGDKPQSFLRIVPNGLLPAIVVNGEVMTESLDIMLFLDRTYSGGKHPSLWPTEGDHQHERAVNLIRLERDLFGRWCNLLFRPGGSSSRRKFEDGLNLVDQELGKTSSPWFLHNFSIVDLTYITHIERMCASVAYWGGFKIRGNGRWPNIERWMAAFEQMPSYMATKSDYYTHVKDIPPQYGTPYPVVGYEQLALQIDGSGVGSWRLPLPAFNAEEDVEPVLPAVAMSDRDARHEAATKLLRNLHNVAKFALRATGSPGRKQFQVSFSAKCC